MQFVHALDLTDRELPPYFQTLMSKNDRVVLDR